MDCVSFFLRLSYLLFKFFIINNGKISFIPEIVFVHRKIKEGKGRRGIGDQESDSPSPRPFFCHRLPAGLSPLWAHFSSSIREGRGIDHLEARFRRSYSESRSFEWGGGHYREISSKLKTASVLI